MFDNIGWGEILVVLIIGLIVIGPERLPKVIEDIRAAIFAARKAINNAKAELNGEFDGVFDDIQKPMSEVAKIAAMGPRAAITKHLLEGEDFIEDVEKATRPDLKGKPNITGSASQSTRNYTRVPSTEKTHQAQKPQEEKPSFNYEGISSYDDIM